MPLWNKLYAKSFFFATLQLPKVLVKRISFLLKITMLTFSNNIQIWNLSVIFERNKTKLLCCIFKFWMIRFMPCYAFKDKIWSLISNSITWYHISILISLKIFATTADRISWFKNMQRKMCFCHQFKEWVTLHVFHNYFLTILMEPLRIMWFGVQDIEEKN